MPAVLGYWKLRGLAQSIRLLLEFCGEDYEEKIYEQGSAPGYSRDEWLNDKFNLGLDFPNLPYFIDGDVKLCQSNSILRYVADKHNMTGKTVAERALVSQMENETMDLRMGFARTCYNPDFENLKGPYLVAVKGKLKEFSTFLGSKKWLVGEELTFPDFHLYDILDSLKAFDPTCLDDFKNLQDYTTRFEALPAVKKYMESSRFIKFPFNNKIARWGGDK